MGSRSERSRIHVVVTLALALGPIAGGCVAHRTPAWTTPTSTMIPVQPAAQADPEGVALGETEWGQRGESEAHVRAAIDAWAHALEVAPTDAVLWARLARAQYFLADAYVAGDAARSAEASELFASAASAGEHSLLARVPDIGPLLRTGQRFTEILPQLDERDVPGLYWRTLALARWARGGGMFVQQALRAELRHSMARVAELDRTYDGAGADRFLGEVWATASTVQGGDLERALSHFEYAVYASPEHFANRVTFALDYATKAQDRALFEHELRQVVAADPGASDVAAENRVEQQRAQAALARVAQLFP